MAEEERALVVPVTQGDVSDLIREDVAAARHYADASRAESTRKKYIGAWRAFDTWCRDRGATTLPADPLVVAAYLAREAQRGLSPSAVQLALAAIAWVHRRAGMQPPQRTERGVAISEVVSGVRREHGRPPKRKAAADADVVRDVLRAISGASLRDLRDRALLAFGMASCMRRSEIVALRLEDIRRVPEGYRVMIARSKTDQEGQGAEIAIPEGRRLRPVHHLEAWLAAGGIADGFLFRRISNDGRKVTVDPMSDRSVARVVQERVGAAGYDPSEFAAHSLRAGFLTAAARAGASIFDMQRQSRHKSVQVLSNYVRSARLFEDHAGEDFL